MPNQYPPRIYTSTEASCGKCNTLKPHKDFTKDKHNTIHNGIGYWCKECANKNARNNYHKKYKNDSTYKTKVRSSSYLRKYGITLQEREELLIKQNYKCRICQTSLTGDDNLTHIDHCHTSGAIRGILCVNCNQGLGSFKDNITNLQAAIDYLNTHNNNVDVIKEGTVR